MVPTTGGADHLSTRCLLLVLCCCPLQDAIVPYIMPFVTENIGKNSTPEDWRLREAATFAFGSMLEGPSPRALAEIVRQAMGFLLAVSEQAPSIQPSVLLALMLKLHAMTSGGGLAVVCTIGVGVMPLVGFGLALLFHVLSVFCASLLVLLLSARSAWVLCLLWALN